MHSKTKGGIGVAKVVEFLLKHEIAVFGELLCDNSEFDLIADTKNGLKTIQVRTQTSKDGAACLSLNKVTPGTRNTACKMTRFSDRVDIFVLYVIDRDCLVFIDGSETKGFSRSVYFRFTPPKRLNGGAVRNAADYALPSFIRR